MHVCHITLAHPPDDDRIYHKECWGLRNWANTISLIAPSRRPVASMYEGISYHTFTPTKSRWKDLQTIYWLAREIPADIYHLHEAELLTIVPFLRRLGNVRIVYDMHEPLPEVIWDFSSAPAVKRLIVAGVLGTLEYAGMQLVDGTVFTSLQLSNAKRWVTRNSTIIYNFPRLDLFRPPALAFPEEFTILYQGQIAPARGILELLAGFQRFYRQSNSGRLRLLGPIDPPEFEAVLRQYISQLNLKHAVRIDSEIPHHQMPEELKKASVGVMALLPTPAFRKSVQGKTFEYLAAGLPIVAGNYPSAHQFVGASRAGLILPETTPDKIAKAFNRLFNHPEQCRQMAQNGQAAVRERFHWEKMQTRLREFYLELMEDRPFQIDGNSTPRGSG